MFYYYIRQALKVCLVIPLLTFVAGIVIGTVTGGKTQITCDGCGKEREAAECRKQLMNEIKTLLNKKVK